MNINQVMAGFLPYYPRYSAGQFVPEFGTSYPAPYSLQALNNNLIQNSALQQERLGIQKISPQSSKLNHLGEYN
jgi:hypothetical protein